MLFIFKTASKSDTHAIQSTCITVSYTHLDVYKRQALQTARICAHIQCVPKEKETILKDDFKSKNKNKIIQTKSCRCFVLESDKNSANVSVPKVKKANIHGT